MSEIDAIGERERAAEIKAARMPSVKRPESEEPYRILVRDHLKREREIRAFGPVIRERIARADGVCW